MRLLAGLVLTALLWADGTVPRKSAGDYPGHSALPGLSVGAEYLAHSVPGEGRTISVEDYLVVEIGLYPEGKPVKVPNARFSLRINGSKKVVPPQPSEMVGASLQQNWMMPPQQRLPPPPRAPGPDDRSGQPPAPATPPQELVVLMALPETESAKPVAGYLYFGFHGKLKSVRTLELLYHGPEGDTSLKLK